MTIKCIHHIVCRSTTERIGKKNFTAKIFFHVLRDNLIDIYKIPDDDITVSEVVDKFSNGNLKKIKKPTHSLDKEVIKSKLLLDQSHLVAWDKVWE